MLMKNVRMAQQIRLWIYSLLIVLTIVKFWTGRASLWDFIFFISFGLLAYLEFCPRCGQLCWWETGAWPNVLWIGAQCRRLNREV